MISRLAKSGTFSFYNKSRDFLPCYLIGACLHFTLHVTFMTGGGVRYTTTAINSS